MVTDRPNLREETISSERFYFGRILDLEVDRVLPPSGAEAEREVIRHLGADVVLPLNEEFGIVITAYRQTEEPQITQMIAD